MTLQYCKTCKHLHYKLIGDGGFYTSKQCNNCGEVLPDVVEKNEAQNISPQVLGPLYEDDGIHSCCNKRLKEEGGSARCCVCIQHDSCEINDKPEPEWVQELLRICDGDPIAVTMIVFIKELLAKEKSIMDEKVIQLMREFSNTPLGKRGTGWDWLGKVRKII